MTVTDIPALPKDGWWSVEDLFDLPDDGRRYELVDGSLLVSPAPAARHSKTALLLRKVLERQAPPGIEVAQDTAIWTNGPHTYVIPDLLVVPMPGFDAHPKGVLPRDVLLAVEILSEHNRDRDLIFKRHYYASVGIPRYWIVDPFSRVVTVLAVKDREYVEEAAIRAGTRWSTDLPFPLTLDPAEFCP